MMRYHQSNLSVLDVCDTVADSTYEIRGGTGNAVSTALKYVNQGSRAVAIIGAGSRMADLMSCSTSITEQIARDFQMEPKALVILNHYQVGLSSQESGRDGFSRLIIDDRGRGHGRTNFGWEPFAGPAIGYARMGDLLGSELFASWYPQLSEFSH